MRILRSCVLVAVALGALWGVNKLIENQRRDAAVEHLMAAVAAAPDGSVVDLATAFEPDWDRAVLIGPYWPGSAANEVLGFDHYGPDDALAEGDGTYLLAFARDRAVVAEVTLFGQAFYFAESVESFDPGHARFRVEHDGHEVVLEPLS